MKENTGVFVMVGLIIVVIILVLLYRLMDIIKKRKNEKLTNHFLKEIKVSLENCIKSGSLVAGHPDIDTVLNNSILVLNAEKKCIDIYNYPSTIKMGSINNDKIKDLFIEDSTSIESRITADRIFALGIYALAATKKIKNEHAFLIIKWNDGKFDSDTIFEFIGSDAFQRANIARNKIIRFFK